MSQFKSVIRVIRNPWSLVQGLDRRRLIDWLEDEKALKLHYKARTGQSLDLDNPSTFNEKLQWLKLHDRNPLYTTLVDKVRVKEWVSQKIGHEYVTPTLGVWQAADEIDLNGLPDRFVLKTNHDNGSVFICESKASFDFEAAKAGLDRHMKRNFFYEAGREWPYKNVKPLIFAEHYLEPDEGACDLADYKVMCFGGEPKLIQVHHGRRTLHTQDFYDLKWNRLGLVQDGMPMAAVADERPSRLDEMLDLSRILSRGCAHVRVDWFIVSGKLHFGEMTFYDAGGFCTFDNPEDDLMMGDWIDLSMAYGPK